MTTYVDQLEKQCIKNKEDLEHLHQLPVVKKAKDAKYILIMFMQKKKTSKRKTRNITNEKLKK